MKMTYKQAEYLLKLLKKVVEMTPFWINLSFTKTSLIVLV